MKGTGGGTVATVTPSDPAPKPALRGVLHEVAFFV